MRRVRRNFSRRWRAFAPLSRGPGLAPTRQRFGTGHAAAAESGADGDLPEVWAEARALRVSAVSGNPARRMRGLQRSLVRGRGARGSRRSPRGAACRGGFRDGLRRRRRDRESGGSRLAHDGERSHLDRRAPDRPRCHALYSPWSGRILRQPATGLALRLRSVRACIPGEITPHADARRHVPRAPVERTRARKRILSDSLSRFSPGHSAARFSGTSRWE
jgi:hypothetical protein